jgi:hypothetical protein
MIRMSLRQFRIQALVGAILLVVAAIYLVQLGSHIRAARDASQLPSQYEQTMLFLAAGFGLVPALVGVFWGAPLIARELETGTHRLAWNQSVPRRRWLAVKLAVLGLASMAVAGTLSALLTWAAAPVDQVAGDRFNTILFGARGVAPIGYAAFGFMFGAVTGLLVRRTFGDIAVCLSQLDLHVDMDYQPNRRFWPFQWIELALYLGFSALLAAVGFWRVHRRVS